MATSILGVVIVCSSLQEALADNSKNWWPVCTAVVLRQIYMYSKCLGGRLPVCSVNKMIQKLALNTCVRFNHVMHLFC